MTGVLIRRENIEAHRKGHMEIEAEIRIMYL